MLSPFRIGGDSLFEFSGGPPSQGHSTHFTPVVSEVSALHHSVLELVPHALVVICGGQGFHVVDTDLRRGRKQWSLAVRLDKDICTKHRNFGAYMKDALHRESVCMSRVAACKCPLC